MSFERDARRLRPDLRRDRARLPGRSRPTAAASAARPRASSTCSPTAARTRWSTRRARTTRPTWRRRAPSPDGRTRRTDRTGARRARDARGAHDRRARRVREGGGDALPEDAAGQRQRTRRERRRGIGGERRGDGTCLLGRTGERHVRNGERLARAVRGRRARAPRRSPAQRDQGGEPARRGRPGSRWRTPRRSGAWPAASPARSDRSAWRGSPSSPTRMPPP